MGKEKVPSWEGKKKMFKDGDPDVFRGFNFQTWKNMTEGERAMWTEFSEVARAPIPKEVIDFKAKVKAANKPAVQEVTHPISLEEVETEFTTATYTRENVSSYETEEPDELKAVKDELVERGIKFSYNSKLETLKKKLADADNTE